MFIAFLLVAIRKTLLGPQGIFLCPTNLLPFPVAAC